MAKKKEETAAPIAKKKVLAVVQFIGPTTIDGKHYLSGESCEILAGEDCRHYPGELRHLVDNGYAKVTAGHLPA